MKKESNIEGIKNTLKEGLLTVFNFALVISIIGFIGGAALPSERVLFKAK